MSNKKSWLSFAKKQKEKVTDYRSVFRTEEGQRVLYDLMKQGHVIKPTYVIENQQESNLNEGKRELVLYILHVLETDPVKLINSIKQGKINDSRYEEIEF